MISKATGKEIVVNDVDLVVSENNPLFILRWDSNIGFGEMTFFNGEEGLAVDTEYMSDNEDKEFIKLVLDKFIEKLKVIG